MGLEFANGRERERKQEQAGAMLAAILSHMTWLGYAIRGDHGLLFSMALVTFASGVTVLWIHRHRIPGYEPSAPY